MSKNITIQEGGVAKQFTAQKLQTNLVSGGTQLWVPEDEAGDYANLEELSVTENGTYTSSQDGFSKVEVDVNPELEDITITRNGVYKSSKYGYGRIDVDVEGGGAETGSLTVTENGTYYAEDDDLDGYDEVIVNVAGGAGSADASGLPTVDNGTIPGGIGSSVIGTDPTDNNEYAVGIDANGNIVKTKVPSNIDISKEPDKTRYVTGETMDYSGIIVILKGGDDAMFTNSDYPNGRVPNSELIFPIDVAPSGGGGSGAYTSVPLSNDLSDQNVLDNGLFIGSSGSGSNYYESFLLGNNKLSLLVCTAYFVDNPTQGLVNYLYVPTAITSADYAKFDSDELIMKRVDIRKPTASETIIISSYTFKKLNFSKLSDDNDSYYCKLSYGDFRPEDMGDIAYYNTEADAIAALMNLGKIASIPVQWRSPYDGRLFQDTFDIVVSSQSI